MPREIALLDALVPNLLPAFLLSALVFGALDKVLAWWGLYRFVWHPPLFRLSCFICIFGVGGLLVLR